MSELLIHEIYKSIQGESSYVGLPCGFVRLTGCPLRCKWCDTVHAFKGGEAMTVEQVVASVRALGVPLVELTGGEPLAQEGAFALLKALCDEGFSVLLETSGSEPIERVDPRVHVIMDLKCPASGMSPHNRYENLAHLKPTDEIKFVVADDRDFQWAADQIREFNLERTCKLLFSPAFGLMKPDALVQLLLDSQINARMQLQIHKYIWHPRAKGV